MTDEKLRDGYDDMLCRVARKIIETEDALSALDDCDFATRQRIELALERLKDTLSDLCLPLLISPLNSGYGLPLCP